MTITTASRASVAAPASPDALPAALAAAVAVRDPGAVAELHAVDAAVLLPTGRLAAGRAAIERAYAQAFAEGYEVPVGVEVTSLVAGATACVSDTDGDGVVRTQVARLDADGVWRYVQDSTRLAEWAPGCVLPHAS